MHVQTFFSGCDLRLNVVCVNAGLALGVCGLGITWQTAAEYLLAGKRKHARAHAHTHTHTSTSTHTLTPAQVHKDLTHTQTRLGC